VDAIKNMKMYAAIAPTNPTDLNASDIMTAMLIRKVNKQVVSTVITNALYSDFLILLMVTPFLFSL
jgi:hypothetical protein